MMLFIVMVCLSCHKSGVPRGKFTGKLEVAGLCGQYTIQLLSGDADSSIHLTKSWFNPANDSTYTNVFAASNFCYFSSVGLQVGDTFTFNPGPSSETCFTCMLYYPTPPTQSAIINVQKQQ